MQGTILFVVLAVTLIVCLLWWRRIQPKSLVYVIGNRSAVLVLFASVVLSSIACAVE